MGKIIIHLENLKSNQTFEMLLLKYVIYLIYQWFMLSAFYVSHCICTIIPAVTILQSLVYWQSTCLKCSRSWVQFLAGWCQRLWKWYSCFLAKRGRGYSTMVSVFVWSGWSGFTPGSIRLTQKGGILSLCYSLVPTSADDWFKKAVHVLLCLCNNACKRSLAICRKSRALCPVSRLLSVPIWPACVKTGTLKWFNQSINQSTNKNHTCHFHALTHYSDIHVISSSLFLRYLFRHIKGIKQFLGWYLTSTWTWTAPE